MDEWLARCSPNHKIVSSSPAEATCFIKNMSYGGDNGASVQSAMKEYMAIDKDGNCTDLWRLEECECVFPRVYVLSSSRM